MKQYCILIILILSYSCQNLTSKNEKSEVEQILDSISGSRLTLRDSKIFMLSNKPFNGIKVDTIIGREGEQFNYVIYQTIREGIKNGMEIAYKMNHDTLYCGENKNGLKHGIWQEYEWSGYLLSKGKYFNNLMEGTWIYYFNFGQGIERIDNYKSGLLNGVHYRWYSENRPYEIGFYENGLKNGNWSYYSNLDYLTDSGLYKNDLKEGI